MTSTGCSTAFRLERDDLLAAGAPAALARLGVLHSRGVLRLRPRHETAAPRPGGDPNLPALPQHHAADAGAGVQAVHGVLCPGCAVEASAIRGLQHLR